MIRLACVLTLLAGGATAQGLPEGLAGLGGGSDGPILQPTTDAPAGPILVPTESVPEELATQGLRFSGYAELRYGARMDDDPLQGDAVLSELRFNLNAEAGRDVVWTLGLDFAADDVVADGGAVRDDLDLPDVREAHVFFRAGPAVDVRLGRQILTWGTGDLIFINDLFPKDQVSFFAGRDDDYLKAPADALRISAFSDIVNADFVVMAPGQTDLFITGERLSFTDPNTGLPTNVSPGFERPDDPEYALRLYRTVGSYEAAAYGYRGHWKSPAGQDGTGQSTFPALQVVGASLRGPALGGIGYVELGQYDSLDDPDGTDARVANSEFRWLIGYEREIARNTTLGLQYMETRMAEHDAYLAGLPAGAVALPEVRDMTTLRLTRLMLNQTLTGSAFLFHSPSQEDGHLRLSLDYDVTDDWNIGTHVMRYYGEADTPFGQFEDASSFGISARFSF